MSDHTQRNFTRTKFRETWEQGQPLPGTFTTAETPAQGYVCMGSEIPPGRFVALSPFTNGNTNANWQSVTLPDMAGTTLKQFDGTDYSSIIADALNGAGNFEIVGVSVDYSCPVECERTWGTYPCPPVGYVDQAMRWKFFRPARENIRGADMVSAVHNDHVWVYTETDMVPGDEIHIRHTELVAYDPLAGIPPQEFGGVTKTADAGAMPVTDTRFANARIDQAASAGGAVKIYLG